MKTKTLLIVILMTALTAAVLQAQVSAAIVDIAGEVEVSRNGVYLDNRDIDFGTELGPYDVLHTGPDGYVELSIESPVSPELSVKVMADTTLFLEHTLKSGGSETSVNLNRGSIQTRAAALLRGGNFTVKTESSVMGIRGTTFTVNRSPDTSILVSCREGAVACTTEGRESGIYPGRIYETNTSGQFRLKDLDPDDIESYTAQWKQARLDALAINGAASVEYYADQYLRRAPVFQKAFEEVESQRGLFEKWEKIIEEDINVSIGDAVKDKATLSRGIMSLRASLPLMQHVFYTLYDLSGIMESAGWQDLSDTAAKTMDLYSRSRQENQEKISKALYYFRIYLEVDRRTDPFGEGSGSGLMDDFLLESPF
ncbi:MAG: FecR family protein [Spirochaetales bacterium]|nr:FecR family protein [Spirochaetales bacterium]